MADQVENCEGLNMKLDTIALLSPGDMGHSVGAVLVENSQRVITCLEGRSERTKSLTAKAGIAAVDSYAEMVREAQMVISIMVPAEVEQAAAKVAAALEQTGEQVVYVDCNAIAPQTAKRVAAMIEGVGSHPVDAGIIGGPPRMGGSGTRFYTSGSHVAEFMRLNDYGLDVREAGAEIGQASGLKMCYAALTKGTAALTLELMIAAERMGLLQALVGEWEMSQADPYQGFQKSLPSVPTKARRWICEMEEIAKTFADVKLTPKIFEGAAEMYRTVGASALADETPEIFNRERTLKQVIELLAKA